MADVLMKFAGAGSDRPPYTEWYDCVLAESLLSWQTYIEGTGSAMVG